MNCLTFFHQFGLLVVLASAWSWIWYQSPEFWVRVPAFAIYANSYVYSVYDYSYCVLFFFRSVDLLFSSSSHTWGGVLICTSELSSLSISSNFWLHWLQKQKALFHMGCEALFVCQCSVILLECYSCCHTQIISALKIILLSRLPYLSLDFH
jgi:hypothetical protein